MHMRGWVRILALTLSILCLLGTPALAEHAAQVSEAYIPLYADASLSNWIGVIHQGAYLTVRGEQNGVAAVTYYGQSGYTPASGLSAVSGEAEDAVVAVNTRLYQLPSTTSAYRSLAAGVSVRLLAVNDGCAMVDVDGTIGFTFRSHLRTASDLGSSAPTEDNNVVYDTFTATVNVQNAYVYASPSTASASMRVLYGRELTVVAYDDTWARVYNGSFYGYILRSALTTETVATPTPAPTEDNTVVYDTFTATVNAQNAYVYASPSTASASMRVLYGRELTVVAYDDTWARVYNGSFYGYILRSALTTETVATPTPAPTEDNNVVYDTFTATVNAQNAYVYASPSTASASMRVLYGRELTVVAYDDTWARVYNGSFYGYILRSALTTETVATPTPAPTEDNNVVYDTFTATVNAQNAYVYASPSTASASMRVLYGRELTVVAYDDTWARVYNGSFYGYILRSALTTETVATPIPTPTPTPVPTPTPTPSGDSSFEQAVESGNYSNEELTFLYLTQEAGLNTAAACGVLANIKAESSFRPTALSSGGGSYGICQWTGSRRTRLQNYCENRGLDYTTLSAQLQFLEYELENYYPKVMNYLRAVDNTAQGAYDAGYYFCYHFEAPSNRASRSVTRGNSARDTYWPKYA